jgi:hypothetical protein
MMNGLLLGEMQCQGRRAPEQDDTKPSRKQIMSLCSEDGLIFDSMKQASKMATKWQL